MSLTSTSFLLTAHFNAGPHSGTERLETWIRHPTAGVMGTWVRADDARVSGVTTLARTVSNLLPGVPYDVATRLTRGGAAQDGSTSLNPLDWPAGHRQSGVQLPLDNVTVVSCLSAPILVLISPDTRLWLIIGKTDSDQHQADLLYEVQILVSGSWLPLYQNPEAAHSSTTVTLDVYSAALQTYRGTTRDLRVRRKNTYTQSAWTTITGVVIATY